MKSSPRPAAALPEVSRRQEITAKVIIGLYATASLASIIPLFGRWSGRSGRPTLVETIFGILNIPLASTPISVLVLWLIWGALLRRKRAALYGVGIFQVLGAAISVVSFLHLAEVGFTVPGPSFVGVVSAIQATLGVVIGVLAPFVLVWVRPAFPARLHSRSWLSAVTVTLGGFLLSLVVSAGLLGLNKVKGISDADLFLFSLRRALGFSGPRLPADAAKVVFLTSYLASVLLIISMCAGLYVLLRSSRSRPDAPSAEVKLREHILSMRAPDSLSYFATRRDKNILVSSDGKASLAYRQSGPVCLVSGDPVGDPASWPLLVSEWIAICRTYGWLPAVMSASEPAARVYVEQGLSALALGDEAVLHPERFTLNKESMTGVRQAVQRARRAGLDVGIHRMRDLSEEQRNALATTVRNWRTERERGFSMALGRFNDPSDMDTVVVVAHTADGQPYGLLTFVPWGTNGLSLDLMLRHPEAPNGTTELMIAELMASGRQGGIAQVSLNFAVFRGVFEDADRLGASLTTRVNSGILGFIDRFTQLESLYRANAKFHPEWSPRYFLFDGIFSLPRSGVAAAAAEGFLPTPFWARPSSREGLPAEDVERLHAQALALRAERMTSAVQEPTSHARLRVAQATRLAEFGMDPYPIGAQEALALRDLTAADWSSGLKLRVYARVENIRKHGGVVFLDLRDGAVRLQAVAESQSTVGFEPLRRGVGAGDLILVVGDAGRSRNGTHSVLVTEWSMAAKALHPIPFRGLTDPEARLRRRSTELLTNPDQAERLRLRSRAIQGLREVLAQEGFMEVETPILNAVHGGASARPFTTFINAYGTDLTLRIAPELQLKRLLVGGLGPIFELARNFRNEGADATHNPEFTALEAYQPFGDYTTMRHLTEKLIKQAALRAHGRVELPLPVPGTSRDGETRMTDVSAPWNVVRMTDAVSEAVGERVGVETDIETLLELCRRHGVPVRPEMGPGALLEELYGELVEPQTVMPTFYVDFPVETSPLAGPHRSQPGYAERWDLVVNGMEIGTAYSELTDPLEQRRRLTEQSFKAAHGDPEAMAIDEDFLYSLETGMPPAGGLGLGVDRIVMLLTGAPIRDVLSFPFVRPVSGSPAQRG